MPKDEKDFFQEATLRICGSLEIEKALWQLLLYLRGFMPSDIMHVSTYDPKLGISKTLAAASPEGGRTLSIETRQPPKARAIIERLYREPDWSLNVRIIESWLKDTVKGSVIKNMGLTDCTAMQMGVTLEGKMLGSVTIANNTWEKYTEEHARLLALLNKPFAIAISNYLRYKEVLKLKDLLVDDNRYLQDELRRGTGDEIVGADFGLKGVMELVQQVATLNSPILLLGETGSGKEVIASAIHKSSRRKEGPFIKVNCGAIPNTLVDSELFGHEKGAFTGAISQKRGRFERANKGTIFLDEIGELTPEAQIRLLRVLQDKEVERVGGTSPIKLDIRVIAATNRDLLAMLKLGNFREDLYFRLKVFPISIPPLRDRISDVPALTHYFMHKKSQEMGLPGIPSLAPGAMDLLLSYHWPGNVRELENAIERALILSKGRPLTFPDLQAERSREGGFARPFESEESMNFDTIMSNHIKKALEMTSGKVDGESGAAHMLKVNPSTLRKRMRKLGITFGRNTKK